MENLSAVRDKPAESCETCCYRVGDECHFCSPNVIGEKKWPAIARSEWCGRYKLLRRKSPKATDAAIMAVMDVVGELAYDEFLTRIAGEFAIHPKSAAIRVERLIARRKLKDSEGMITLAPARKPGRPKADAPEVPEPAENPGSPLGRWENDFRITFGGLAGAAMFSELRDFAREIAPISNAAFSKMLTEAVAAGLVIKTEDRKYWLPPKDSPPAEIAAIEAPE